MEFYPEDLLVGASPLVFAVNAIHNDEASSKRSLFDRFLDALAASLNDREIKDPLTSHRTSINPFLADDNDDSSDDELFTNTRRPVSISAGLALGRLSLTKVISAGGTEVTSYNQPNKAKVTQESFFDRARIQTISLKHGFPPSKDPYGNDNVAYAIGSAVQNRSLLKLQAALKKYPIDGILPAGWLEKHTHALPSVIIVACTVCNDQKKQAEQDKFLFEAIENLQESLVAKRQCKLQIVGLMSDEITTHQGEIWLRSLSSQLSEGDSVTTNTDSLFNISLLRANSDLDSTDVGMPTSPALHSLHGQLRQASMSYYSSQIARVKNKIKLVNDFSGQRRSIENPPIAILPLLVRYYWQIALFFEFQLKHRKSLQAWNEAYRQLARCYQYIIKQVESGSKAKPESPTKSSDLSRAVAEAGHDSVEVAFRDTNVSNSIWNQVVIHFPPDMLHQCRAVAEWIHVKLLLSGLAAHNDQGLYIAAEQIRQHTRTMSCRQQGIPQILPAWYDYQYISRQRMVLGQLLERYPISIEMQKDVSVMMYCSTWRTYASAAEDYLRLSMELKNKDSNGTFGVSLNDKNDTMRARYLGCLDQEELQAALGKESASKHEENAAKLAVQSITMFEKEQEEMKRGFYAEDDYTERVSSRTGAGLYYLAGGIFLGMQKHEEAFGYLEKASKLSKGWHNLELSIRRMLIECYEKHLPTSRNDENSQTLASMILDSYFNAAMSPKDLRRALHHFSSVSGGGDHLKWFHATIDEDGKDLPISFHVTFPEAVFATVGDVVKASIHIKSNLDYAVHVNSIVLKSFAGELHVPTNDLMAAKNANEGVEGKGIIIQRKSEIQITTDIELPKRLSGIGTDDSGNGGVAQATAGKGSFAKNARPRTANITSAGGARLISEDPNVRGSAVSQGWSLRFLGGKPLRYDGMNLQFYPVQVEKAGGGTESVTLIELVVEKREAKTHANIKRTPFEEENYISSAWARPQRLPLSAGPRSIRVLGPQPQLVVTNISKDLTGEKALEGTVNRVLLKLESGIAEKCTNMQIQMTQFSVLMLPSGSTLRLVPENDVTDESEASINMSDPYYRSPVLVRRNDNITEPQHSTCGYDLPSNWVQVKPDTKVDAKPLNGGEFTYIYCDVYRPTVDSDSSTSDSAGSRSEVDGSICKTDIYVTISYQQERPVASKQQKRGRRPVRRKPAGKGVDRKEAHDDESSIAVSSVATGDGSNVDADEETSDIVSLDYSCSLVWCTPLSAYFQTIQRDDPCGKMHSLNRADGQAEQSDNTGTTQPERLLIDGESVSTRCSIAATHLIDNVKIELRSLQFMNPASNRICDVALRSNQVSKDNVLFQSKMNDMSRFLVQGSSFSTAYAVQTKLCGESGSDEAVCNLGSVLVVWAPSLTPIPDEAHKCIPSIEVAAGHGPLVLENASKITFSGPSCTVKKSPFVVTFVPPKTKPRVAVPFQVQFEIVNRTNLYQNLVLNVASPSMDSRGTVFAGLVSDKWQLEPLGKRTIDFTIVSPRAGPVSLPEMTLASSRFKSWVVQDSGKSMPGLYVFP